MRDATRSLNALVQATILLASVAAGSQASAEVPLCIRGGWAKGAIDVKGETGSKSCRLPTGGGRVRVADEIEVCLPDRGCTLIGLLATSFPCIELLTDETIQRIAVSYCDGGPSGTWRFYIATVGSLVSDEWIAEEWIRESILPAIPASVREEARGYNLAAVRWERAPNRLWVAFEAPPTSAYREFGKTRLVLVDVRERCILRILSLADFEREYPKVVGSRLVEKQSLEGDQGAVKP